MKPLRTSMADQEQSVQENLRELPSVDRVVEMLNDVDAPRVLLVNETRRMLAAIQVIEGLQANGAQTAERLRDRNIFL